MVTHLHVVVKETPEVKPDLKKTLLFWGDLGLKTSTEAGKKMVTSDRKATFTEISPSPNLKSAGALMFY